MLFVELLRIAFPDFQETLFIERKLSESAAHAILDLLALRDCRWFAGLLNEVVANANMLGFHFRESFNI